VPCLYCFSIHSPTFSDASDTHAVTPALANLREGISQNNSQHGGSLKVTISHFGNMGFTDDEGSAPTSTVASTSQYNSPVRPFNFEDPLVAEIIESAGAVSGDALEAAKAALEEEDTPINATQSDHAAMDDTHAPLSKQALEQHTQDLAPAQEQDESRERDVMSPASTTDATVGTEPSAAAAGTAADSAPKVKKIVLKKRTSVLAASPDDPPKLHPGISPMPTAGTFTVCECLWLC
jgi:sulfite reductase alpha subunit-like flavoprotein